MFVTIEAWGVIYTCTPDSDHTLLRATRWLATFASYLAILAPLSLPTPNALTGYDGGVFLVFFEVVALGRHVVLALEAEMRGRTLEGMASKQLRHAGDVIWAERYGLT